MVMRRILTGIAIVSLTVAMLTLEKPTEARAVAKTCNPVYTKGTVCIEIFGSVGQQGVVQVSYRNYSQTYQHSVKLRWFTGNGVWTEYSGYMTAQPGATVYAGWPTWLGAGCIYGGYFVSQPDLPGTFSGSTDRVCI